MWSPRRLTIQYSGTSLRAARRESSRPSTPSSTRAKYRPEVRRDGTPLVGVWSLMDARSRRSPEGRNPVGRTIAKPCPALSFLSPGGTTWYAPARGGRRMRTGTRWSVLALIVCVNLLHDPAHAMQYVHQRTLTSPAGTPTFTDFGSALATVGSNLAVGDDTDSSGNGGLHGSVSLFDGATLALLRYIPAPVTGTVYFG